MSTVVTFGEIMLRLSPPGFERLLQSPRFEANFGGGEANVAVALACLGQPASYVTVLPENPLADACLAQLRGFGVDTSSVVRGAGRMGLYFLEHGASQRSSKVLYDRVGSAIALAKPGDFDWSAIFRNAKVFHITGITPAISASAADLTLESVRAARQAGVTVVCDLNYRKNLWQWGSPAGAVMPEIVRCTDVLVANEEDVRTMLGMKTTDAGAQSFTQEILDLYPNLRIVTLTQRESRSALHNGWSACLHDREQFLTSRHYEITHIVDRVGSGDSFTAGMIYGLLNLASHQDALEFATALGCLKHSIPGDFCRVTLDEVKALLKDGGSGRVQR